MFSEKRFLVFGAHPDDADLMFGGTALKLITAGHKVKFVSVTNQYESVRTGATPIQRNTVIRENHRIEPLQRKGSDYTTKREEEP